MNDSEIAGQAAPSVDRIPGPGDAPRRGFAMGLMVVASIVISFGGLIVRNIEDADPWQINLYRSTALIVAITLILALRYGRRTVFQVRRIGRPGLAGGAMLSVAGICFLQALSHATVATTLFILSAIPFITAGLAWVFLKERLERATLVTMAFAAVGITIMVAEGFGIGSSYGIFMALGTALCFSGFAVVIRRHRRIDMLPTLLVSGAIIVVIAFVMRIGDLGISPRDFWLCVLWGGVLSGLANWMFILASRHLLAAEITLFMLLEFALGPLWVWLFVGETPTPWILAGGALVIASVAVRALFELRRTRRRRRRGDLPNPS